MVDHVSAFLFIATNTLQAAQARFPNLPYPTLHPPHLVEINSPTHTPRACALQGHDVAQNHLLSHYNKNVLDSFFRFHGDNLLSLKSQILDYKCDEQQNYNTTFFYSARITSHPTNRPGNQLTN